MPRLSDRQFESYEFRARKYDTGSTDVVAYHKMTVAGLPVAGGNEPVGAMKIERVDPSRQNYEQQQMNTSRYASPRDPALYHGDQWRHKHHQLAEPGGQMRWAGGNMEPLGSRVSWLGMSEKAPRTLLKGMMAVGVAVHGSMPTADYDLSQYGAKISQGAARKYGVKPHPRNEAMGSTFRYSEPQSSDAGYSGGEAEATRMAAHVYESSNAEQVRPGGTPFRADRWQVFSAARAGEAVAEVERAHLGKQPKPERTPIHPNQQRLL